MSLKSYSSALWAAQGYRGVLRRHDHRGSSPSVVVLLALSLRRNTLLSELGALPPDHQLVIEA